MVFPYNNPVTDVNPKPVVLSALSYITNTKYALTIITVANAHLLQSDRHNIIAVTTKSNKKYNQAVLKILDNSYDIVEVHQRAQLAATIAKKYSHIKVCLIKHGCYLINNTKEKLPLYRWFYYHYYLRYLYRVFCISQYVCLALEKKYPKYYSFNILYNSYGYIPLSNFKQQLLPRKSQIVFSGKPVLHKGIKELFESLIIILSQYPQYNALIMGAIFSSKKKYRKTINNILQQPEIKKLIAEHRIIFKTNLSIKDVFTNLLQSDIALMLTKTAEPFGLSCLEYHLASCAVISSAKGGLKEINQDNALLLQHIQADEIVKKVAYLIQNPDYKNKMAESGRTYVQETFNPIKWSNFLDAERAKSYDRFC